MSESLKHEGQTVSKSTGFACELAHELRARLAFRAIAVPVSTATIAAGATATACGKAEDPAAALPEQHAVDGVGYPVTTVDDYAFSGKDLASVEHPETVTRIGMMTSLHGKLEYVDLADDVLKTERLTCADNELTDIKLPPRIQIMGDEACVRNNLSEANLPNTVWQMTGNVFTDNSADKHDSFGGKAFWLLKSADHRQPSLGRTVTIVVNEDGKPEDVVPEPEPTNPATLKPATPAGNGGTCLANTGRFSLAGVRAGAAGLACFRTQLRQKSM